jgi:hypothetical protein
VTQKSQKLGNIAPLCFGRKKILRIANLLHTSKANEVFSPDHRRNSPFWQHTLLSSFPFPLAFTFSSNKKRTPLNEITALKHAVFKTVTLHQKNKL